MAHFLWDQKDLGLTGVPDPPDYPNVVDMGAYERYEFCGDPSQTPKAT